MTESSSFALLHPNVQRWIWRAGWDELRDIQEDSIRQIITTERDVLITGPTASGKTECALLPLASMIADDRSPGVKVLYIAPTRALLNDQADRAIDLFESVDVPVLKWHGDVAPGPKKKFLRAPYGVLQMTPESLEALLMNHGYRVAALFATTTAIVIDEIHSFAGEERGAHLQSLLARIEHELGRRLRRVALTATAGDQRLIAEFLRPGEAEQVTVIRSQSRRAMDLTVASEADGEHLSYVIDNLGARSTLVFANSRRHVEELAADLQKLALHNGAEIAVAAHHGSLSRDHRESVEELLATSTRPVVGIATTTLELGVDIGEIDAVIQVDSPPTVGSLHQRAGRSGRRGGTAVTHVVVTETNPAPGAPPTDYLQPSLVQAIASADLVQEQWSEPPTMDAVFSSTLTMQILALIRQYGEVHLNTVFEVLCQRGPFRTAAQHFDAVIASMRQHELIALNAESILRIDTAGDKITSHYRFYAAFSSPVEYEVIAGATSIGTLPVSFTVKPSMSIIFAGKYWSVDAVNFEKMRIHVSPTSGGNPPVFRGSIAPVHRRVRQAMLSVYRSETLPSYLTERGTGALTSARHFFTEFGLAEASVIPVGSSTHLFPWTGDDVMNALCLLYAAKGLKVSRDSLAIAIHAATPSDVQLISRSIADAPQWDAALLAKSVGDLRRQKHHRFLPADVLAADYAAMHLDVDEAYRLVGELATAPLG